MICEVCDIRSSEGFCVECETLLCDQCGERCGDCGKFICPKHVFELEARALCFNCAKGLDAIRRKRSRRVDYDSEDPSQDARMPIVPGGELDFWNLPAWAVSTVLAGIGACFSFLILLFGNLRTLPLPNDIILPTPFLVLMVPILAILWALSGMIRGKQRHKLRWYLLSLGIASVSILLTFIAFLIELGR